MHINARTHARAPRSHARASSPPPPPHTHTKHTLRKDIDGKSVKLDKYKGQVALIVNTASACGFTPQYEGMQALYEQYAKQGFVVLGFPCNQFGAQEPGTSGQIKAFAKNSYGVTFPLFSKVDVNGAGAEPLFAWLKAQKGGLFGSDDVKWNFTKVRGGCVCVGS